MRLRVLGVLALLGGSAWWQAPAFAVDATDGLDPADIPKMHDTYERNEARFFRDFRGRHFKGTMKFANIKEDFFSRGSYNVFFSVPNSKSLIGDIECHVSDDDSIKFVTELDKGATAPVDGVVTDHEFGAVVLSDCRFPTSTALPLSR